MVIDALSLILIHQLDDEQAKAGAAPVPPATSPRRTAPPRKSVAKPKGGRKRGDEAVEAAIVVGAALVMTNGGPSDG